MSAHPAAVLLGAQGGAFALPVCDHYSGVEARMRKSLQLQAEMSAEFGACVFDVTLDCEDGAPVGGEAEHAALVSELALTAAPGSRVAVRVHAVDHPAFEADVATVVGRAGHRWCHVMVPKVESVGDVERAVAAIDSASDSAIDTASKPGSGHTSDGTARPQDCLPLHVLVESPAAVHRAFEIAAHPRVASISFGLMDFVSAHGGAIPASGMGVAGQFSHPLVLRAKLDIASACHAHGKVPSHCVVTEFKDAQALRQAALVAAQQLGYTRMWSIHPDQIRPILEAFAPQNEEIARAADIIALAHAAHWAPLQHAGQLHDRASYRYFWQLLERAHRTGRPLPAEVRPFFATMAGDPR